MGISRLQKERCFCVGTHSERGCGCEIHVQLSYYLKAFQLFRKAQWIAKRGEEDCTCKVCRDQRALGRQQLWDCTSFSDAVHASDFCSKDEARLNVIMYSIPYNLEIFTNIH